MTAAFASKSMKTATNGNYIMKDIGSIVFEICTVSFELGAAHACTKSISYWLGNAKHEANRK